MLFKHFTFSDLSRNHWQQESRKVFFVLFHFVFRLNISWFLTSIIEASIKNLFKNIVSVWDPKCKLLIEGYYKLSTFVVLEKILESPLDCKEIELVNSKGDQSWTFIGRTHAEAQAPTLWLTDAKNWLIWKHPDAGKDWRQEEKGTTRGWDGWMASLTWWTWVWASSRSWWQTGKPGMLQSMRLQRVKQTEQLNRTELLERLKNTPFSVQPRRQYCLGEDSWSPDLRSFVMSTPHHHALSVAS